MLEFKGEGKNAKMVKRPSPSAELNGGVLLIMEGQLRLGLGSQLENLTSSVIRSTTRIDRFGFHVISLPLIVASSLNILFRANYQYEINVPSLYLRVSVRTNSSLIYAKLPSNKDTGFECVGNG